jgi:restriction system protein
MLLVGYSSLNTSIFASPAVMKQTFSDDAKKYVSKIDRKIVLIDRNQLGEYLIDNNIGVKTEKTYQIKKVDIGYFGEENL